MPTFNFGDKLAMDRKNLFIQLKSKDERFHLRFIGGGSYDGKHFIQNGDKWDITYCPRIMDDLHCEHCEVAFSIQKQIKELKETDGNEQDIKKLEKELRPHKVKITFYYPVIDRDKEQLHVLKTSLSVRLALEDEIKNGIDVTKYDYYLTRTEKPGSEYYKLTRIDSSETKPLTEEEEKELKQVQTMDLEAITKSKRSSMSDDENEEEKETTIDDFPDKEPAEGDKNESVNPDDIPF